MAYTPIVGERDLEEALQRLRQVLKIDAGSGRYTHEEHQFKAHSLPNDPRQRERRIVELYSIKHKHGFQIATRPKKDGRRDPEGLFVKGQDGKRYLTRSGAFGSHRAGHSAFKEYMGQGSWIEVDVEKGQRERFVVTQIDDFSDDKILENVAKFVDKVGSFLVSVQKPTDTVKVENDAEPDGSTPTQRAAPKVPLNRILYGPPGTGKTYDAVSDAVQIIDGDEEPADGRKGVKARFNELRKDQIEFVTFHQSYAYEDFIEGIRPVLDEDKNELAYELRDGIFKEIAKRAIGAPTKKYVLIIDEINRGNIAKIFGELITLIEPSKRLGEDDAAIATLPYSRELFGVPRNLHLIGTMNTADRGIMPLDAALRRRFGFDEKMPRTDLVEEDIEGINGQELLKAINERIVKSLDRDHQIGHTYLMRVKTLDELKHAFQTEIIPLLQEYFYDDWEKMRRVLNENAFITESKGTDDRSVFDLLPRGDEKWRQAERYQVIYNGGNSGGANDE